MPGADLADRQVAVLGAGREGLATVEYLLQHAAVVTVCEQQPTVPAAAASIRDRVTWRLGPTYLDQLGDFDLVFRSPGIPILRPELQAAIAAGVEITSQTKYFFAHSPAEVIGVSGTKGKGTTAGLLDLILKEAGRSSLLGGNIGKPPLEFLDSVKSADSVVLELSSYQLQDLTVSPAVAILTNLTVDHLDYHRTVQEYHQAKSSLVRFQQPGQLAIFNADDPGSRELAKQATGSKQWFSVQRTDTDAYVADGRVMLAGKLLCQLSEIPVPGRHNAANVMAAGLAATHLGINTETIASAIRRYHGLPYHLELVGERDGVRYFNDSYATNPTATIPALQSFGDPVILLAGGADKGLDYEELADAIVSGTTKAVILIDPVGSKIAAAIHAAAAAAGQPTPELVPITDKADMLPTARRLATTGDVVLLSPAAASFGWFANYQDRGRYFTEQVQS